MKIEVAVQCHNYQKRMCWMISSMLQQEGIKDLADFKLSMSIAHVKGTGNPSTEQLEEFYRPLGLDIRRVEYPSVDEFQYRGFTRNRQLAETDADWILFADCDMVYPKDFFKVVYEQLGTDKYRTNPHCLHSGRYSTTLEPTEELIEKCFYPSVIPDAYEQMRALPGELKANIGAGFCQLVKVNLIRNSPTPYYIDPKNNPDNSYKKFHKTRSDQVFRRRLGREKIPLPLQVHIQHIRDNQVGHHIEDQR